MIARSVLRVSAGIIAGAALVLATAAPANAGWRDRIDRTPPTTPSNLRATEVTQTSVSVAWNASTDNVKVVSYTVWAAGASVVSVPHPQTTATLTGLRPGTAYQIGVVAFDGINTSAVAALNVTTQPDVTPPTAPTDLALATTLGGFPFDPITASTVLLRWNSSTDEFHPVRHEVLVNGTPSPNLQDARAQGSPFPSISNMWVRQLEPGTTYEFRVRGIDPSGNRSDPSEPLTVTTEASADVTPPTASTLTRASSGGTSSCPEELELRWTASTDDIDPPTAIEYEIRVNGTIVEVLPWFSEVVVYTETDGPNVVTVVAVDKAGNAAPASNSRKVTVRMGSPCPL